MSTTRKLLSWAPYLGAVGLVGGLVWWTNLQSSPDEPMEPGMVPISWQLPDRANPCFQVVGPTPRARVDKCLALTGEATLTTDMGTDLKGLAKSGKPLVIGKSSATTDSIPLTSDMIDILLGTDEAAAAKLFTERGIRSVIVTRDLAGALDRDSTVLSRIAQHDYLEWFNLKDVGADTFLYSVRTSPARMPLSTGTELLAGLRARIAGKPPVRQSWTPENVQLIGTMRLQGQTLVTRFSAITEKQGLGAASLERAMDELAAGMRRDWERKVEITGVGRLEDRLPEIRMEIHVITERANVEPRSRYQMFDLWEIGIDGVLFKTPDGEKDERFSYLTGSQAINRSLHTVDDFLQAVAKDGGWRDRRPWEDKHTQLDLSAWLAIPYLAYWRRMAGRWGSAQKNTWKQLVREESRQPRQTSV